MSQGQSAGQGANIVVASYVESCQRAGHDEFLDRDSRAILGSQAKRLLAHGYALDVLVDAARANACTDHNPAFLEEWARRIEILREENAYLAQKRQDSLDDVGWLDRVNAQLQQHGRPLIKPGDMVQPIGLSANERDDEAVRQGHQQRGRTSCSCEPCQRARARLAHWARTVARRRLH